MADADRAIPVHQVGATPTTSRSIPVALEFADEPVTGKVLVPKPPASGTKILTATDGVLSWEDAA